ncbi:hypothetical protein OE88DRAFT_1734968 [Heliocybe sulcata]|uniref:ATP-grasp domain-containing protein n=1 Tax=Heliocybe sulcata TaxID=5364 RepID=A0A5C3N4D2_9AGAM|nr:hypothetical protein OE88DRAFT_1734968 [Heliocybe sulcata]
MKSAARLKIDNPTRTQITVTSILLICLSLLIAPISLSITAIALLCSRLDGAALHLRDSRADRKTVLITGGRTNKGLVLLRAFKRQGYRVLIAEEACWGHVSLTRFSRAADGYYSLPEPSDEKKGGKEAYKKAIVDIVGREGVDIWVPCSSIFATVEDAETALEISNAGYNCDTFIQHPDLIDSLHWKDRFMPLCTELGFQVPQSQLVTSCGEAIDFLFSPDTRKKGYSYILKCVGLDDAGRSDLTLLPLKTMEATIAHFAKIPVQPSRKIPFVLQRYIGGPEYCTHGVVRDGRLLAFVASRSSDMVLRYLDLESYAKSATVLPTRHKMDGPQETSDCITEAMRNERDIGRQAEEWTVQFLQRWAKLLREQGKTGKRAEMTGHFSFDFLLEESEGRLYPIECNPRAHTAVALLSENPLLASAYTGDLSLNSGPTRPTDAAPRSWLSHELPLSFMNLIPDSIASKLFPILHPRLRRSPPASQDRAHPANATLSPFHGDGPLTVVLRHLCGVEKDVSFDYSDPLPFFILAHVQIPWILATLLWQRKGWSRINTSTARVYAC